MLKQKFVSKDNLKKVLTAIGEKLEGTTPLVSITYAELVELRDGGKLVPGRQYRITDYECTTTQDNTQSVGHQFDIIVTADDVNVLNEVARATLHEGDEYFADSDLSAWQVWYDLDNDINKYLWADAGNGKGVIYRMIDEFNNDVPYDFKNIQFKRWKVTSEKVKSLDGVYCGIIGADQTDLTIPDENDFIWCYTMSAVEGNANDLTNNWEVPVVDASMNDGTIDPEAKDISNGQYHWKSICEGNIIGEQKCSVITDGDIQNVTKSLSNNVLFSYRQFVVYQEDPVDSISDGGIPLTEYAYTHGNVFGLSCTNNTISCSFNSFGNDCDSNTFGNNCGSNTFGDSCSFNSFGNDCDSNTFGDGCYNNTFGDYCYNNTFGDYCYNNTFGNGCYNNTFGNGCYNNTFGDSCSFNSFGNDCDSNTFGNDCDSNTFGISCNNNTFGQRVKSTKTPINYVRYVEFADGVEYVDLKTSTPTANINTKMLKNISIHRGLKGTYSKSLEIEVDVLGQDYEIIYTKGTDGTLQKVVLADLWQQLNGLNEILEKINGEG